MTLIASLVGSDLPLRLLFTPSPAQVFKSSESQRASLQFAIEFIDLEAVATPRQRVSECTN